MELVRGESGMGKTALLRAVTEALDPTWTVAWTSGNRAETQLPYGVFNQFTAQLPPHMRSDKVPPGLTERVDPLYVGSTIVAALGVVTTPLCFVLDDAQWIDDTSALALGFVMRRFQRHPILVLAASTEATGDFVEEVGRLARDPGRGDTIVLTGLGPADVSALVRARTAVEPPPGLVRDLVDVTRGNPLHLTTVLDAYGVTGDLAGEGLARLANAAAADLSRLVAIDLTVLDVLEECPPQARGIIEALAVLDAPTPPADVRRMAQIAGLPDGVDAALATPVVRRQDDPAPRLTLAHRQIADAVLSGLGEERRVALHAAAAQVTGGTRSYRHRLAALTGPDEDLARELEERAAEAAALGEAEIAVRYGHNAAQASAPGVDRDHRLIRAGAYALHARRPELLAPLQGELEAMPPGRARSWLLGHGVGSAGDFARGMELLAAAADGELEPPQSWRDRAYSAMTAGWYASATVELTSLGLAIEHLGVALGHLEASDDVADRDAVDEARVALVTLRALDTWLTGDPIAARAMLDAELDDPSAAGRHHAVAFSARGGIARWQGDLEMALDDLVRGRDLAEGDAERLSEYDLVQLALTQFALGQWNECAITANALVTSTLDGAGRRGSPAGAYAVSALVPAARGNVQVARMHLAHARSALRDVTLSRPLMTEAIRLADLTLARAHGDAARVLDIGDLALEPATYVSALVQEGRLDEATAALDVLEHAPRESRPSRRSMAPEAWCRLHADLAAARGDAAAAARWDAEGLALPTSNPYERGLLEESAGRRARADEASRLLSSARRRFDVLGAVHEARRAEEALGSVLEEARSASGSRTTIATLTQREHEVAHLAARGYTNREAAAALFVSEKAVEYHMSNILAKLALTSRRQLRGLLTASTPPAGIAVGGSPREQD
ncbi:transcriptional regulator, LuxR family [Beutenbergia cavernae DSM 12333]|uniref:Transcriptional regulator, LuxR family n=1 Tax=Beutenbergia cavernae (strain ATCC BAA-8 / DSM 12333 / CCUG 43141 / JCM 11478 / NBRC 16432 / NCIMB 13614 / HKI 0122) TaxID=471853 RepID=C5C4X9_BEUC1|nr:transcriptional regulator, LuxR family [Beutenbergia cavernae DSM 12333]